ncbi:MAG: hypothetical protein J6O61_10730 [Butyrivibrio sp.]|uniref:sialate O-acetylesterase n=1 Tax=Butyrivibrio sp. TaxID=28121 RepID=UPI001B075FCF|nr:sialate O-acetylesterase [Butyrivibrio sp.]MBO6241285.1 hypothetical protein [Butyrivibrio sp.]
MSTLRLSRLLSDGAVIQRRKSIHIWGWDEPGAKVTAVLEKDEVSGITDSNGRFDIYLPARESGGPYELVVSDDKGERIVVRDVMLGLVWLCSGQSNMELPLTRCKDRYPEVVKNDENDRIRTFKIVEETSYCGPFEEHHTGSWTLVRHDTIMDFSAVGYFFAKHLQKLTGQTIGIINASLGGSRIFGWMGREMLEGYDELLEEADHYADKAFYDGQIAGNIENGDAWRNALYQSDEGIKNNWQSMDTDDSDWGNFEVPGFFKGTDLDGFIGSVWFRKKFDLPKELAGKAARLFLGTMVDSDTVFVNGQKVGETAYQYPPRKYDIPEGLTRENDNEVVIRLCVENGLGRFTPGKELKIFNSDATVYLNGTYKYKVAASCERIKPTDFVNWKATGLFNGMTAPCKNYPIDGVVWYQGESNVELPQYDYADLTKRMILGYRKLWNDENLPFIAVQLPNFVIDQLPCTDDWGKFRLIQNRILDIPMTGLVVTLGLGEDNDLHPTRKEPIGERMALWAAHMKYGYGAEYKGPEIESIKKVTEDSEILIEIKLGHAGELIVADEGKGSELKDFYLEYEDGKRENAEAALLGDKIFVKMNSDGKNVKLKWCCENTYHGGLVENETGTPLAPFEVTITE